MNKSRKGYIFTMKLLMWLSVGITAALVLFLLGYILVKGIPHITWELLSTKPSYIEERIGILPNILNTLYIILATLVFVIPLGVGAAIYLTEYAKNKRIVTAIEYAAETLSGIPSIIYGLVGMLFFCQFLNMKTSLLAGALTLVIESAYCYAHYAGKPENRATELPGRCVRTWSRKMAGNSYCGTSRLCRWGGHRMYPVSRKNSWRIGGAFIHSRTCPRIIWII